MKRFSVIGATLIFCSISHGATYGFHPDQGKVSFMAKGKPALISINGTAEGLSGTLLESSGKLAGEISFELKRLKTGIELRDTHMKDKYLEVEKYPHATLKIEKMDLAKPGQSFAFAGTLSLHGVSKPIKGEAKLTNEKGQWGVTAEFPIQLSQFGITIPNFQGITVAEDVQVKIDTPVTRTE